ncbi:hypothetical protein LSAT2_019623 [Lamellibrachia satsuma]|nr:hypothetical protein LSAT2_019623 [Lamellibrachia satsuma]
MCYKRPSIDALQHRAYLRHHAPGEEVTRILQGHQNSRSSTVLIVFLVTVFSGLAAERWMDCAGQRVSSRHYRCCDGVRYPVDLGKSELCCGKGKIDIYSELCCDGIINQKHANTYRLDCCGRGTFSSRVDLCCGDVVHAKIPGAACCGDDVFYSDRQTCHDGKPVDKNMTQSK